MLHSELGLRSAPVPGPSGARVVYSSTKRASYTTARALPVSSRRASQDGCAPPLSPSQRSIYVLPLSQRSSPTGARGPPEGPWCSAMVRTLVRYIEANAEAALLGPRSPIIPLMKVRFGKQRFRSAQTRRKTSSSFFATHDALLHRRRRRGVRLPGGWQWSLMRRQEVQLTRMTQSKLGGLERWFREWLIESS